MQFYAMLQLIFYPQLACLFLKSGHSHMVADRVVAWTKGILRGKNLYHPVNIAEHMNRVRGVEAVFLQATDASFPFRTGWADFLMKHFKKLPDRYTFNHFFEFCEGVCTMRRFCDTPNSEASIFKMCNDPQATKIAILRELFGVDDLRNATMSRLTLPKNGGKVLTKTKLVSLAKKYSSIPEQIRSYYPDVSSIKIKSEGNKKRKREKSSRKPKRRKPGRPKKVPTPVIGFRSILQYFKKE